MSRSVPSHISYGTIISRVHVIFVIVNILLVFQLLSLMIWFVIATLRIASSFNIFLHNAMHPPQMRSDAHKTAWIAGRTFLSSSKRNHTDLLKHTTVFDHQRSTRVSIASVLPQIENANGAHSGINDNTIPEHTFAFVVRDDLDTSPAKSSGNYMAIVDITTISTYEAQGAGVGDVG